MVNAKYLQNPRGLGAGPHRNKSTFKLVGNIKNLRYRPFGKVGLIKIRSSFKYMVNAKVPQIYI